MRDRSKKKCGSDDQNSPAAAANNDGNILLELGADTGTLKAIRQDLIKLIAERAVERLKEKLRAEADDE